MHKYFIAVIFSLLTITGCKLTTPEISGVVLDAETKEPVAEAWISATISITTKTVAGDVGRVLSLEPPHLRTDKDGRFVIPSRDIKKPPFPIGFGTKVDEFSIGATTLLDKSGSSKLNPDELGKRKIEVTVYVEDFEKVYQRMWPNLPPEELEKEKEISIFSGLQGFYSYCLTGRSGIEVYVAESPKGCDEWELNYAIVMHERYLERYESEQNVSHYSIILEQLAYLVKKQGNYEKALDFFKSAKDFDQKNGIRLHIKEYDQQIIELEQLLKNKKH